MTREKIMFVRSIALISLWIFLFSNRLFAFDFDARRVSSLRQKSFSDRKAPLKVSPIPVSARESGILNSTNDDAARVSLTQAIFERLFHVTAQTIAMAPGRDNEQGEHVDYPEEQLRTGMVHLYSMGGALQNNFIALVARRNDRVIRMAHCDGKQVIEFTLDDLKALQDIAVKERALPVERRAIPAWANHTMGVLMQALERGQPISGIDILLTSNVPFGAGLSNSAANCVGVTMALNNAFGWNLNENAIVAFARDSEHDQFVGSTCGWLDQLLIAFSKEGHFAMIDYATRQIRYFKSQLPAAFQRVLVNTNVPHELAQTEYNDRNLIELPAAYQALRKLLHEKQIYGSTSLTLGELNRLIKLFDTDAPEVDFANRDLLRSGNIISEAELSKIDAVDLPGDAELLKRFKEIGYTNPATFRHNGLTPEKSFALCLRRMRHQLTSAIRTPLTGKAAEAGNREAFAELINAEGMSLRMNGDFQITGENGAQDALLDIGITVGRELGIFICGRMEGGGGGGNVGFRVDRADEQLYQAWLSQVAKRYAAWVKTRDALRDKKEVLATFIEPKLASGARLIPDVRPGAAPKVNLPVLVQGYNLWALTDNHGITARVSDFGAQVIGINSSGDELLWHETNGATLVQANGLAVRGGMPFMFPWTSRIENGMLKLIGKDPIDLKAFKYVRKVDNVETNIQNVLHGITDKIRWDVVETGTNRIVLSKKLRDVDTGIPEIGPLANVFGDVEVRITYSLENGSFNADVEVTNLSDTQEAVLSFGFHPFYKLGPNCDGWEAMVKGNKYWDTDRAQVPKKTNNPLPVDGTRNDLRSFRPLTEKYEVGLTDLIPEGDGVSVVSRFVHKDGRSFEVTQDGRVYKHVMFWVPIGAADFAGIGSIQPTTSSADPINMVNVHGIEQATPVRIPAGKGNGIKASWSLKYTPYQRGPAAAPEKMQGPVLREV